MINKTKNATKNASFQDLISTLDVDVVGITVLAEWEGTKLEETALRLLPQAHSVVIFAMEVYPEILDLTSSEKIMGAASMNDLLARNVEFLNGRLTKASYDVAKAFHGAGLKALPLPAAGCPMDTRFLSAVFSYKHAAHAAGLGRLGRHSLLITPDFGPRVRLSCCLTEAALEPTTAEMAVECDDCSICLDNCPAEALTRPRDGELYAMNKFACSSFLNASGGCCECMRLCPLGR